MECSLIYNTTTKRVLFTQMLLIIKLTFSHFIQGLAKCLCQDKVGTSSLKYVLGTLHILINKDKYHVFWQRCGLKNCLSSQDHEMSDCFVLTSWNTYSIEFIQSVRVRVISSLKGGPRHHSLTVLKWQWCGKTLKESFSVNLSIVKQ